MERSSSDDAEPRVPWTRPWPPDDLEHLGRCPVCGGSERELLHRALVDACFRCAPGTWSLWRCSGCRCGYLDPRPTRGSIARAYATYYTHEAAGRPEAYEGLSALRKLRRRLVNGYLAASHGARLSPESPWGRAVVPALAPMRTILDHEYRHLPPPPPSGGDLLDVGCGSGAFLLRARTCGWRAVGVEPDPSAAANAARQGLEVQAGGVELFEGQRERFDAITLSHVIEHVHDPVATLAACRRLLKPGGLLWLETPNLESLGHLVFGAHWRGLEAPRHLVLFGPDAMRHALRAAGLSDPTPRSRPTPAFDLYDASLAIRRGADLAKRPATTTLRWGGLGLAAAERLAPSRREFLTLVATAAS